MRLRERLITRQLWLVLILWAVLLGACQPHTAPPDSVIEYGQTVHGQLTSSESHWLFGGKQGDTLSIVFNSTGSPDFVGLLDPVGTSIARLSLATGRLDRFKLPADGQYTIVIGAGSSADYTLTLALVHDEQVTATSTPIGSKNIGVGDSRLASLNASDAGDLWSMPAQSGTVISIAMNATSGTLDPFLRLFAPDGTLIASDDDSGGGHNALISGVNLPATGIYLIQASGKGHAGDYLLAVTPGTLPTPTPAPTSAQTPTSAASPIPPPTLIPTADSGAQVRIGQTVQGLITNPQDMDHFAVFGPAGAVISIGMFRTTDSSLVPAFEVLAPNGNQVAAASGPAGAIVNGYTLPATGAYIVYAHGDHNKSSGPYTLTVGDGFTLRDMDRGDLTPNVAATGSLERIADRDVWSLDLPGNATFSVDLAATQPGLDPTFDVVGPDGKVIGAAQPDLKTHTAQLAGLLTPQRGRFLIRVDGIGVGNYALTARLVRVLPTATFSVALDQSIDVQVQHDERYTFSFKAVPGVVVTIEAQPRQKDKFDPVIEFYGPSGRRLAIANDTNTDPASPGAFLQIALDDGIGAYTVQVHGYAMMPGAFTLHVKTE